MAIWHSLWGRCDAELYLEEGRLFGQVLTIGKRDVGRVVIEWIV
jgi:hypothetical protein